MNRFVDLNCDMGEGVGNEPELMPFISSANIACGFHAGDKALMEQTARYCIQHEVAIGAHPSFPDRENFGRTPMKLSPDALAEIITEQVSTMSEICSRLGVRLNHVKPHGALYNMAATDPELAEIIVTEIKKFDSSLILYGLSGSKMADAAIKSGLSFFNEVFADRTYRKDGTLTPRSHSDALILSPEPAADQAFRLAAGSPISAEGSLLHLKADTICIHGDGPDAVGFASAIQSRFRKEGIHIGYERKK